MQMNSVARGPLFLRESSSQFQQLVYSPGDSAARRRIEAPVASLPPRPETNPKKMSDALCIVGSLFGSAEGQQECGSCYLINMGSVLAIVASDIVLTILITISVFCFVTHHKRRQWNSHGGRRNVPSSKKTATEVTESPYQELHGVQSDVYSELRHFRK